MTPWGGAANHEEESEFFSDDPIDYEKPKRRVIPESLNKGLMFFVFLVTSSVFVGNTLAANVVINNGRIEFGQGVAKYKACSGSNSLVVKQGAQFTGGTFKLKSIEISNIPVECYGLNLIVSILKPGADGTGELATLFGSVTRLVILDRSGTFYTSQSDASYVTLTSTNNSGNSTDTVFISFDTPTVLMTDVGTLGVESSANTLTSLPCGAGGDCAAGETGPGGGKVVYYSETPFPVPGSPCDLTCYGIEIDATQINVSDQYSKNSGNGNVNGATGATRSGMGAGYYNTKTAWESANGSNRSTARFGAIASCWNKTTTSATDRWYLPSVMEYAYLFKRVKDANAAFRTSAPGWPAATNYYSSEEATASFSVSGYTSIFNADGPYAGFQLEVVKPFGSDTTQALAVAPSSQISPFTYPNATFSNYVGMRVFNHPKNNGYAYICIHSFK